MDESIKWQVKKNRLDIDYQQLLQKYQVVSGAVYAIPITVLGIFLSQGLNTSNFVLSGLIAFFVYRLLADVREKTEKEITALKTKVTKLAT